jgi:serine/threonine protein kinase
MFSRLRRSEERQVRGMELSVQNIYGLLLRSRLLSADDARVMFERWQAEAREKGNDAGGFARWMVANRYVTEYQATLLARGHADCFFVNEYKVLDRLGRGRMAGVYKAQHSLGQTVAIKVLPPSKAKDQQLRARFQREARLAMKLRHPNVVRTFQIGETAGLLYLVMECLEGETLDDVLQRRKKLPLAEAVRVAYLALLGLQHVYEQGMVHRDIKPANLMIVPSGTAGPADTTLRSIVKILDMSLARALADEPADDGSASDLTGEGTLLGTPDYMAPEQARDAHAADIRADIYSMGCVLYHMLARQAPFSDSNVISQMLRHASEAPRPLKEFNATVPDGLQQIVSWMMAKDPAKRYPTPERAAQALQVFLVAEAAPPANPEAEARMRSYLTWLDSSDDMRPAPPKLAQPAAAPPEKSPAKKHRKPETKKKVVPTAAPAGQLDVELLPVGVAPRAAPPAARRLAVSRRDFLAFGLGVASVLVAIFLGWVVAKFVGH